MVVPNANESGSTCVACWLVALVYGSAPIEVSVTALAVAASVVAVDAAMAVAGVLAMGVMTTFAVLYLRGLRQHRALLLRFASLEAGTTWTLQPVDRSEPAPPPEH